MSERDGPVRRVVRLLDCIAASDGPVTVRSLASKLDLAPSTVHRMLQTLHGEGLVARDRGRGRYSIGPSWYRMSARVVAKVDVVALAEPVLEELGEASGEACLLGLYLPHEHAMTFAARHDSPHPLGYRIALHETVPLVWGASGKVILAHLEVAAIDRILAAAGPSPVSGATLDRAALDAALDQARRDGYLISRGEKLPGAVGIAAPVFGADEHVVASVCLTVPETRFAATAAGKLGEIVRTGSRQLSVALGGPDHDA